MVLDDFFADREAQAGAVGLAVRGEGLEQRAGDLGRDAAAGVLDLDVQEAAVDAEAEEDRAAVGELSTALLSRL